jgi:Sec-independent protein translocase protein TatA
MEFLGIGPAELLLILLVIILVIGPKDIGKTARSVGRFLNRLYKSEEWRTLIQASKTIRTLPNRLAREAELEEIQEVKSALEEAKKDLDEAEKEISKDSKEIGKIQSDLIKETEAIEEDMQAWVKPAEKETTMSPTAEPEVKSQPESQKEVIQEKPYEGKNQDE